MKISRRIVSFLLAILLMGSCLSVTALAAEEKTVHGIGFVTASALYLRKEANASSASLSKAVTGECVVVLSKEGEWYKVNYNLQEGYMHSSYLKVATTENAELGYGKITGTGVNLRKGPGTDHPVVSTPLLGTKCYILGINEGWYKVIHGSEICYVRSDFLELTEIPYENPASPNEPKFFRGGVSTGIIPTAAALNGEALPQNLNVTGQDILSKAKEYLGTPYVYGGASPSGFDCSGYVYYIYKSLGFSPGRTPAEQAAMGTPVADKASLQPGDIVLFCGTAASGVSHTGIYAGSGQFIHAPNSRSVVSYSDLTSGYWSEHYFSARRIAK